MTVTSHLVPQQTVISPAFPAIRPRHHQRRAALSSCKSGGKWLETALQSSPGRPLAVQIASASSSAGPATELSTQSGNVQGAMLDPSVANKNWVRLLAASAAVLAAARFSPSFLSSKALGFVHLLAFGTYLGTNIWTTFIAGLTMFKNLPRHTFGKLQSKLFPPYFALLSAANAICLSTIAFAPGSSLPKGQAIALGLALATSVLNWLWVEPVNTKLILERYSLENQKGARDEAKIKQMKKDFGKWHGASSVLNLAGLCGVLAHGWWLGSRLSLAAV